MRPAQGPAILASSSVASPPIGLPTAANSELGVKVSLHPAPRIKPKRSGSRTALRCSFAALLIIRILRYVKLLYTVPCPHILSFFFLFMTRRHIHKETLAFYLILLSKHIGWHLLSIRGRVLGGFPVPNFHFGSDDSRCSPEAHKENEKTQVTVFS